jgi:hypothetical protein
LFHSSYESAYVAGYVFSTEWSEGTMQMIKTLAALSPLLLGLAGAANAAGTATKAWVSGKGADAAGCGVVTQPCRTFQFVHDNIVAPSGEILVLDPAGYSSVNITQAISITNVSGIAFVPGGAGGAAITINAGAGNQVTLRGLTIDGSGVGATGIQLISGAMTLVDSTVQNFTSYGVHLAPVGSTPAGFNIADSRIMNNGGPGIQVDLTTVGGAGTLEHVLLLKNNGGVIVNGGNIPFNNNPANAYALTVRNSAIQQWAPYGIYFHASQTLMGLAVRDTEILGVSQSAIDVAGSSTTASASRVFVGICNGGFANNSALSFSSYGDNSLEACQTPTSGSITKIQGY